MQPTKAECLANAKAAWALYEKAFERAAFYELKGDSLQAQRYNEQKKAYQKQALDWEARAKEVKG